MEANAPYFPLRVNVLVSIPHRSYKKIIVLGVIKNCFLFVSNDVVEEGISKYKYVSERSNCLDIARQTRNEMRLVVSPFRILFKRTRAAAATAVFFHPVSPRRLDFSRPTDASSHKSRGGYNRNETVFNGQCGVEVSIVRQTWHSGGF